MATEGSGSPGNRACCSARATGCRRSGPDAGTKPAPAPGPFLAAPQPAPSAASAGGLGGRRQSPRAQDAGRRMRRQGNPAAGFLPLGTCEMTGPEPGADIPARQPPHLNPPRGAASSGSSCHAPSPAGGAPSPPHARAAPRQLSKRIPGSCHEFLEALPEAFGSAARGETPSPSAAP